MTNIMVIRVDHRSKNAPEVQGILTKHGCIIKLRVGCHETNSEKNSEDGIILLHLNPESEDQVNNLEDDLKRFDKITVKKLEI